MKVIGNVIPISILATLLICSCWVEAKDKIASGKTGSTKSSTGKSNKNFKDELKKLLKNKNFNAINDLLTEWTEADPVAAADWTIRGMVKNAIIRNMRRIFILHQ